MTVKEVWKSVNISGSYGQEFSVLFIWFTTVNPAKTTEPIEIWTRGSPRNHVLGRGVRVPPRNWALWDCDGSMRGRSPSWDQKIFFDVSKNKSSDRKLIFIFRYSRKRTFLTSHRSIYTAASGGRRPADPQRGLSDWLWRPPLKWPILCRVGR